MASCALPSWAPIWVDLVRAGAAGLVSSWVGRRRERKKKKIKRKERKREREREKKKIGRERKESEEKISWGLLGFETRIHSVFDFSERNFFFKHFKSKFRFLANTT